MLKSTVNKTFYCQRRIFNRDIIAMFFTTSTAILFCIFKVSKKSSVFPYWDVYHNPHYGGFQDIRANSGRLNVSLNVSFNFLHRPNYGYEGGARTSIFLIWASAFAFWSFSHMCILASSCWNLHNATKIRPDFSFHKSRVCQLLVKLYVVAFPMMGHLYKKFFFQTIAGYR
jgi:hypothetical protein